MCFYSEGLWHYLVTLHQAAQRFIGGFIYVPNHVFYFLTSVLYKHVLVFCYGYHFK